MKKYLLFLCSVLILSNCTCPKEDYFEGIEINYLGLNSNEEVYEIRHYSNYDGTLIKDTSIAFISSANNTVYCQFYSDSVFFYLPQFNHIDTFTNYSEIRGGRCDWKIESFSYQLNGELKTGSEIVIEL